MRPGFARNLMAALRRVTFGVAVVCVILPMSFVGAQAACDLQRAADMTSFSRLLTTGLITFGNCPSSLTREQAVACREAVTARNALAKCEADQKAAWEADLQASREAARVAEEANAQRVAKEAKLQAAKQAKADKEARVAHESYEAFHSELVRHEHEFMSAVEIGMSAAEVDAADRRFAGAAYNGFGKTVNTTVTAGGTTQQWIYRFSHVDRGDNDFYVYLRDGVVSAIQK